MDRVYIIKNTEDEYCASLVVTPKNVGCAWTKGITKALVFDTYSKAYSKTKRINKAFGVKRAEVLSVTEKNCKEWFYFLSNKAK